jgi:hypothetical protein
MEVGRQRHALTLYLREAAPVCIIQESGLVLVWTDMEERKSPAASGLQTLTVQQAKNRYTTYPIPVPQLIQRSYVTVNEKTRTTCS